MAFTAITEKFDSEFVRSEVALRANLRKVIMAALSRLSLAFRERCDCCENLSASRCPAYRSNANCVLLNQKMNYHVVSYDKEELKLYKKLGVCVIANHCTSDPHLSLQMSIFLMIDL